MLQKSLLAIALGMALSAAAHAADNQPAPANGDDTTPASGATQDQAKTLNEISVVGSGESRGTVNPLPSLPPSWGKGLL